jgi:hypothetical protein
MKSKLQHFILFKANSNISYSSYPSYSNSENPDNTTCYSLISSMR